DRALTKERSLVVTWLNRGTLHLVRSEDYPWLHALTTPPLFTTNARRLAQTGVTPDAAERAVAVVERSLAEEGPLTRAQLRDRIAAASVPTEGQALCTCSRSRRCAGSPCAARWWVGSTPTRSSGTGSASPRRST